MTIATTLWAWPPGVAGGVNPHLSAAFSIDVDGRWRHDGAVSHLPGVRTVLKNPVVSDTWGEEDFNTAVRRGRSLNVHLQLRLGENGGQSVSADFDLSLSVVRGHVSHALLIRVHLLHVVPAVTVQGDLGERAILDGQSTRELTTTGFTAGELLPTIPGQFVCWSLYPGRRLVPASFRPAPSCRRRTTPAGVGGLRVCDLQHSDRTCVQ